MAEFNEYVGLAKTYASALLDLAEKAGIADEVAEELQSIGELIESDADFAAFVDSPLITGRAKSESLEKIFSGQVSDLTLRFLRVLAEHDRSQLLRWLAQAYQRERDNRAGRIDVEITTAVTLDESQRSLLRGRLAGVMGGDVILHQQVDPDLIGGLVVRVGDTLFDGSIRQQLEQLREQVIARGSHEIQGGRNLIADQA